jgi:AraC-like DNA-binding protein
MAAIEVLETIESLFDRVPGVVFFVKDRGGRYLLVNETLVARCGAAHKSELIGCTTDEVFPEPLGSRFRAQDLHVCRTGRAIVQQLELHLYPTRREGWCLTDKLPLRLGDEPVAGVVGTSRDLLGTSGAGDGQAQITEVLERVRSDVGGALTVGELAAVAGLSVYQLNRRLRLLFGITAGQLIIKSRVDAASEMLRSSSRSVAEVAHACGYCDQSAFTRVFRRTVGLTPRQYRQRHRP